MTRLVAMALAAVALAACALEPDVGAPQPPPAPGGPTESFSTLAQTILVPRCATASCHAGESPPAYPPLDAGLAYGALVESPSQQAPMLLVVPFDPANSYLVKKLRGTAGDVGVASPMPISDAALDEPDIQAIEAWIANGAPND